MCGINDFIDKNGFREVVNSHSGSLSLPAYKKHVLEIKYENSNELETVYSKVASLPFANSSVFKASIVDSRCLTGLLDPVDGCKEVYEVTLDVKDSNIKFKAGDTIGVIPENRDDEVTFILSHLGLQSLADIPYKLNVVCGQKGKIPLHIPIRSTLKHVLKHCVDLRGVLKKLFLLALSKFTKDEVERKTLEYFCSTEGSQYYHQYVLNNGKNNNLGLIELFKVFKSCKPPIEVLLSYLPRLLPRPYSIVNSGLKDSSVIKICFSVLPSSLGKGLTTGWLENMISDDLTNKFRNLGIKNGSVEVPIYLRINNGFSLPEDKKNPMILIAVGTAISPFIGFLEELEFYKDLNPNSVTDDVWLFYGCRDPKIDHIYEKELNEFREKGVLKELKVAFSHLKNGREKHVQDSLTNNCREITELIGTSATIFVCGDLETFANSIKSTLVTCLLTSGKTEDEASEIIRDIDKEKRFIVDSWA